MQEVHCQREQLKAQEGGFQVLGLPFDVLYFVHLVEHAHSLRLAPHE